MENACINCKFYIKNQSYCSHPKFQLKKFNYVTGKTYIYDRWCETMRENESCCGHDGKFFEQRLRWYQKLYRRMFNE